MQIRTSWVRDCGHLARLFRPDSPLPYAFAMFAWVGDDPAPAAMVEFYFYDEARHYDPASVHDVALALGPSLALDEVAHIRDARVRDPYRSSELTASVSLRSVALVRTLGARYLTASSAAAAFLSHYHEDAHRLGTFCVEQNEQAYYLVRLTEERRHWLETPMREAAEIAAG